MTAHVSAIYRYPVKGFTPEQLKAIAVAPGKGLANDRIYAVENGPSGFDEAAPTTVNKTRYTVLMNMPRVAAAQTRLDDVTGVLTASAEGVADFSGRLAEAEGREGFAVWLAGLLGEDADGPLKVLQTHGEFRFTDSSRGQISIINLASVRDLSERMGVELDPLRFRGNLYIEGWPAWVENEWVGRRLRVGEAQMDVVKRIQRCLATHVNPTTAERDAEVCTALFDNYGHVDCGIYMQAATPAQVKVGDPAGLLEAVPA
jgi:uncharacterized protein YcbX